MAWETSEADIKDAMDSLIEEIRADYDEETDRETIIERLDEECDSLFGGFVKRGMVTDYTVEDMVSTAEDCAKIIRYAEENAWVEDDRGLWEGLTYGVLASIAYFSLRNVIYQALKDAGIDTNDDFPLSE